MSEIIENIIKSADKLGALGVTSVWAFFTIILLAYIVWVEKNKRIGEKNNFEMRIKDAETDNAMATAVSKMADQIKELRFGLKCTGGKND